MLGNDDFIDEEFQIMNEQDTEAVLSSSSFEESISALPLKKAITFNEECSVSEVVNMMQEKNIGSVILTKDDKVTGIFTERDVLMKIINKKIDFTIKPVKEFMTKSPQCLRKEDMIAYVLNNMHVGGYRHIPIVDKDHKPESMVSIKDILSYIFDHFPNEISHQTGEPFRGEKGREGA